MKKLKNKPATADSLNKVFDIIDESLINTGSLPTIEENVSYENYMVEDNIELPESLSCPEKTIELGRKILKEGFSVRPAVNLTSNSSTALAQAARNGNTLSEEIINRMHEDRSNSEINSEENI